MRQRTKDFKPRKKKRKIGRYMYIMVGGVSLAIASYAIASHIWGPGITKKAKEYFVNEFLNDSECYSTKVEGGKLYASFRGEEFQLEKKEVVSGESLDGILYILNHEQNQDLEIKGSKLRKLKELFALLKKNELIKTLDNKVSDSPQTEHCNSPVKDVASLVAGESYFFPVYGTRDNEKLMIRY